MNPEKAANIGVAAHITAASPGGVRHDTKLSSSQRSAISNGIWLCQSCAKLIDNDPQKYTTSLLHEWKAEAEARAAAALETRRSGRENENFIADIALIRFYSQCFDRPAFQDKFSREGSMEDFDKAIEDTITAINTGTLLSREGKILARDKGKSFLNNVVWRERMDVIVDLLRAMRSRYKEAVGGKGIHIHDIGHGNQFYAIHDRAVADWIDHTRAEIIGLFSQSCKEANLPSLRFPRKTSWRYFDLPQELEDEAWRQIKVFEEEQRMPYITSAERIGRANGLAEGRAAGLLDALGTVLRTRFGAAGEALLPELRQIADSEQLQAILARLLIIDTIEAARDTIAEFRQMEG